MHKKLHAILFSIGLTVLLSACGGGGGGGGGSTNHAPALSAVSNISMVAGNTLIITLTATDSDNDTITYSISGGSASTVNATVSGNVLTLTPATGFVTTTPITMTATASDNNGGSDTKTFTVTVTPRTQAILTVSTANIPSGTLVGSVQVSIILPVGVSPSVLNGNDASGSVALVSTNGASLAASSYDASNRKLTPGAASGSGFASGALLTITCSIDPSVNSTLTAADFSNQATVIDISDTNNNTIPGATSPVSITFQ